MPKCLIVFSSFEELTPVFDRGGNLILGRLIIQRGYFLNKENCWEIGVRGLVSELPRFQETLIHEFVHAFDSCQRGWRNYANQSEKFFHEVSTEREGIKLFKRDPLLAEKIVRQIILHPLCSISHAREINAGASWGYCRAIAHEVVSEARRNPSSYTEAQRIGFVRIAQEFKLEF